MYTEHDQGQAPVKVDLSYLHEFSGGDKSFIKEIIQTFIQEAPENIAKLSEGLSQKDWDKVYRMAHQLKSNYMMLGMSAQQEVALAIEKMAKTAPAKDKIDDQINKLIADTEAAIPVLREKLVEL